MPHRVLYIEDDRDNRLLVRRVLDGGPFEVLEARSAREGIAMAEEHQPDIILMDITMPGMDGLTATRLLRANPRCQSIPIVALTANVMRDVLDQVFEAGCDGYITKPIQVDLLAEQILSYLHH